MLGSNKQGAQKHQHLLPMHTQHMCRPACLLWPLPLCAARQPLLRIPHAVAAAAAAAGNGGFWQATGTEIHTGEVTTDKLPDAFPRVRVLFFCPYAQNGLPYTHAICPQSIVGTLNVSSILKEPAININKAWDVQEVFHPLDPAKPLTSGSYRPKRDNRVVNTQGEPKQG
jgi:hypothetical protein